VAPEAPPAPEEPPPPELDGASRQVWELVERLGAALRERDLSGLRALADPDTGTWYWASPGTATVPCTWIDPMDDVDPFDQEGQGCAEGSLLGLYADALGRVSRPDDPSATVEDPADLAPLRTIADEANASSSVQRAIAGAPIRHAYRADLGDREVVIYLTDRAGALFVSHVIVSDGGP